MSFRRRCSDCGVVALDDTMKSEASHRVMQGLNYRTVTRYTCKDVEACEARSGVQYGWSEADELDYRNTASVRRATHSATHVDDKGIPKGRFE